MIRLERRTDVSRWLSVVVPAGSLLGAMLAGGLLLRSSGSDPVDAYVKLFQRGFTGDGALSASIVAGTPLLFCGLAAAAAFRMGLTNVGGEGQLFMGAVASSGVGLRLGPDLGLAVMPLMMVAGVAAGAAWAAIPGILKARFDTNEIITSLMLNYVATNLASYLIFNSTSFWRLLEGSGRVFPQGRRLDESTDWPFSHVGPVDTPFGLWVGISAATGLWVLYRRTRFGFEVRVIGDSAPAARYAGMRTRRKIVAVMALSGGLAGLGGASDVGDFRHVLDPKGLGQSGYGYTGIVVAALARLNPFAVVVVAIVMGGLANAGRALQGPDLPAGLVGTLQGLLLFFAVGGEVVTRYRVRRTRPNAPVESTEVPA